MSRYVITLGLSLLIQCPLGYGDQPVAIIGGQDNGSADPYAALISPSGIATEISGAGAPTGTGTIFSVAISGSGAAIIGGQDNGSADPYAALISPSGIATEISGAGAPLGGGLINSVAINGSGVAIIGGVDNGSVDPYAALVSPSGIATEISGAGAPTGTGLIYSVAINQSGAAIIGGQDNGTDPYAALVSPSGIATEISGAGTPTGTGTIYGVGINGSGAAIIGGQDNGSDPYAALVSPSGIATEISGAGAPIGTGIILSVAISGSDTAIIGGFDNGSDPYAALVSSSGITTEISGAGTPTGAGAIISVAINESGAAIIGGFDNGGTDPYAALVSSSGIATEISGAGAPTGTGVIDFVAINGSGATIIGGFDNGSDPYAALISPSGIATEISGAGAPTGTGTIYSVAILEQLLEAVVPTSFGPGSSFANSLFALSSQVLSSHLTDLKIRRNRDPSLQNEEIGLLADASDLLQKQNAGSKKKAQYPCEQICSDNTKYSLWAAPFGDYAHQKRHGNFSAIDNWIAGGLAAFDYLGVQDVVIGCGAAYAYNYAHLSQGFGHAKTNQEFLTIYGSWIGENLFIDFAVWGGLYQMKNVRHSIAGITSKSNVDGWLLDPHLEISTPFYANGNWFLIDPFAMFDWANNWQSSVHEKGASGFNLNIGHQYTSLLRSEVGLRFYESFQYGWGMFVLQEKASWVNKLPFHSGAAQAIFVGGISSFAVDVFSNQTQNLGNVQLNAWFFPCDKKYPYGSLNYQGEFGSSFQNHLISFEVGKDF